jgi:hypothetical protein
LPARIIWEKKIRILEAVLAGVLILATACRQGDVAPSPRAAGVPTSAVVPITETELAAFRSGMTDPHFLAGPATRDSLVQLFQQALARRDTAGLDRLQITREEFAYLYYPDSKLSHPPYELGPDVMWIQIQSQRERGLRRLLAKYGERRFRIRGLVCQPPERQNRLVIHQCAVRTSGPAGAKAEQLFGSIIERDGRFKFVGYANRL